MVLLGHNRLAWIDSWPRRFHIEERWQSLLVGCWSDDIAEADVDLQRYASAVEINLKHHPHAFIFLILADTCRPNILGSKHESIISNGYGADGTHRLYKLLRVRRSEAEEIEVTRKSVWLPFPDQEERGTFENEPVGMLGMSESKEKPLTGIAAQHKVEDLATRAGKIKKSLTDGSGGIHESFLGHRFRQWTRDTGG